MIELAAGRARAAIDSERGGRLASLRVGDRELLAGPVDDADRSIRWGCFLMAPWPGRLADGRLRWRGRTIQLGRTWGRHAIHGLAWSVPWRVERSDATSAVLSVDVARDGWPFAGEVRQSFRLGEDGIVIEASIVAGEAMPAALGWHPWFLRAAGGGPALEPSLRVDADGLVERRAMLPTGAILPLDRRTDLRGRPRLGRRRLDDAYAGVRSPAVLRWPDLELRIEFRPECRWLVVYSPPDRVCVEPMTAAPNALGLDDRAALAAGRRDLAPGQSLEASMTIRWLTPPTRPEPGRI